MDAKILYDTIDSLREIKGWSVYELSKQAGISQSTIYSWRERGTLPSLTVLESICDALGISICNVFNLVHSEEEIPEDVYELVKFWIMLNPRQKKLIKDMIGEIVASNN